MIASLLEKNTVSNFIDLSCNCIGSKGAKLLATAFEKNKTIEWINLSDNKIGDEGAKSIATALEINNTIGIIELGKKILLFFFYFIRYAVDFIFV